MSLRARARRHCARLSVTCLFTISLGWVSPGSASADVIVNPPPVVVDTLTSDGDSAADFAADAALIASGENTCTPFTGKSFHAQVEGRDTATDASTYVFYYNITVSVDCMYPPTVDSWSAGVSSIDGSWSYKGLTHQGTYISSVGPATGPCCQMESQAEGHMLYAVYEGADNVIVQVDLEHQYPEITWEITFDGKATATSKTESWILTDRPDGLP